MLAGSDPQSAGAGELAVIDGQGRRVTTIPSSGPLRISSAGTATACAENARGSYRGIDLTTGQVSSAWEPSCAPTNGSPASQLPATSSQGTALPQVAGPLPPSVAPSYYEDNSYIQTCASSLPECPPYQQGRSIYTPSPNALVVLDFGAPCYVPGTSTYGAQMFGAYGSNACVRDSTIGSLVQDWITGYEADHGAGTSPVTLAIGTSNSLNGVDPGYMLSTAQMQASGQAWYQQLVAAIPTSGLAAPITIWGASDIEQSSDGNWYGGGLSVAWVNGYAAASPAQYSCNLGVGGFLADYGDDVLGGSGSADGWTVSQVYQVAWGLPPACAVPEIYYSGMASEWQALSQWGATNASTGAITFSGVMTEVQSGSFSPAQGWDQLQSATGQSPPIPCLTEIGTALQGQPPQVVSVTPASGPQSGGTQVTIDGVNFFGAQAVDFGGVAASSFTVTSPYSITATSPPGAAGFADVQVETDLGTSSATGSDGFIYSAAGAYHPLAPVRIEDTRPGSGLPGSGQPPGPGQTLNVQVAGVDGVPTSGVAAVMVNLTVTDPTATSFVTAFPAGVSPPPTSSMDFNYGLTKANLVEVAVGRNGQISVYNQAGTTQVLVDIEGWYDQSAATSGTGLYNPTPPQRIVDTRSGSGENYAGQTLGPGQSLTVQVAGQGGIPASGAEAVVLNVTATDASMSSYLTVFPAGGSVPLASNLNFLAGQTLANQVVVEVGLQGQVTVFNDQGSVDVVVDVAGWFSNGGAGATSGSDLNTTVPMRAADTRSGSGEPYAGQTLGPGQTLTIQLSGVAGLPALGMTVAVINVTVTNGTAGGYLQTWPAGQTRPTTSELNWAPSQTTENLVVMAVGSSGQVSFYNGSVGTVDLVVDADGWFAPA